MRQKTENMTREIPTGFGTLPKVSNTEDVNQAKGGWNMLGKQANMTILFTIIVTLTLLAACCNANVPADSSTDTYSFCLDHACL